MIRDYQSAIEEVFRTSPSFQNVGRPGYHPGLDTMRDFDTVLEHPHRSFRTIHIAGTNGKGSVAHFMASCLAAHGYRTGLYTSPHLVDFRERIKIIDPSGEMALPVFSMIQENDVLDFLDSVDTFIRERHPSFFEITTAMAFDWFRKNRIDIAVIECGLGGRLDSTNITDPELSIITTIGFDHKDILGDTIEAIAAEKAGIIRPGVPVVCGAMPPEAFSVISGTASATGAPCYYAPEYSSGYSTTTAASVSSISPDTMDLQSVVQIHNLRTVAAALDILIIRGILQLTEDSRRTVSAIRHTALRTGLRGRWETLSLSPRIVCDIGHNENALSPVMSQLKKLNEYLKPEHFYMIYGMAADKDIQSVIPLLPQDATYIFTNAAGSRAMPAGDLKELITSGWDGEREDIVSTSVENAVSIFEKICTDNDLLYIGGSSYVVAEAIPLIEKDKAGR